MYGEQVLVLGAMCALVTDHELMRRSTMVMTELPGCYSGYPGHILVLIRVIDIRCCDVMTESRAKPNP